MRSASALKLFCSYPAILDKLPPRDAAERKRLENRDESARRGGIFHAAVDAWVQAGSGAPACEEDEEIRGWLELLAFQWTPHGFPVETELAWGLDHEGNYAAVTEPEPHVYAPIDPTAKLLTAGRADACWPEGDLIRVPDWKSGRTSVTPAATNLQANASGMAPASRARTGGYIPGIYYARDGVFDWGDPVMLGSPEHRAMFEMVKTAALLDDEPHVGEHCGSCWSKKRCNAYLFQKEAT